ncbi:hypothetical protein MMC30_001435 [Trapelia coarctata]|nr:hypothetical protein [Trapelia coarctata]
MFKSPVIPDDDSLSVNSTVPSEPRSEYPLQAILAERDVNGTKKYLVKWEGYPDERCTWETESNFQDDRTLREWGIQKSRIKSKAALPYDVSALETRVENWIAETEARKARRRAKRVRLGLPVASEEPEDPEFKEYQDKSEDSSSDVMDYEYTPLTSPKRSNGQARHRTESSRSTTVRSESENEVIEPGPRSGAKVVPNSLRSQRKVDNHKCAKTAVGNTLNYFSADEPLVKSSETKTTAKTPTKDRRVSAARKDIEDDSSTEEPLMRDSQIETPAKSPTKNQTTSDVCKAQSKALPRTQQNEDLHRSSFDNTRTVPKPLKSSATTLESSKALLREKKGSSSQQLCRTGSGPARIANASKSAASKKRPPVTGAAIFGNWDSTSKKRKSMQLPQGREVTDTANPRNFGKLSIKRWYEKAGRFEPAPNPDQLTFLNVKDGKPIQKPPLVIPSAAPKTPFQMIQENLLRAATSTEQTDTAQNDISQAISAQADIAQGAVGDDDAMFLDAQVESPGTIGTERSNGSETMNDALSSPKKSTVFDNEPQSRLIAPIEQRDDTITGICHSHSEDLFLPPLGASPEPDIASLSRPAGSVTDNPSSNSANALRDPPHDDRRTSSSLMSAPMSVAATMVPKDPPTDKQNLPSDSIPVPMNAFERNSRDNVERMASSFADAPWNHRTDLPEQPFRSTSSSVPPATSDTHFMHPIPPISLHRLLGDDGLGSGAARVGRDQQHYVDNLSDVYGTIFVGAERIGDVRFRGLGKTAKPLLMSIKVQPRDMFVRCEQICTAEDYRSYFHSEENIYYGAGHVVPWPQTADAVHSMAETLKSYDACGVFFAAKFAMIVYPAGLASWRAFDNRFPRDSPPASLRFVMRAVIPNLIIGNLQRKMPPSSTLIMENEEGPNALFRQSFGIEYAALLPGGRNKAVGQSSEDLFFLLFPSDVKEECGVVTRWLLANDAKVFSSSIEGDWDKFATTASTGVVLIHESFLKLHLIPHLARLLQKPVNLFYINLQPTIPPEPEAPFPPSTLTRLFPHGAGILITDSLVLNHPQIVTRILTWFRFNILVSKPYGTWRIVMRPRPRSWLLDMAEERPKEEARPILEIYEQIWYSLPLDLMDENDDYETPLEDAPIQCSIGIDAHDQGVGLGDKKHDTEGLAKNDNRLVEWFAGWSRTKVEYHRKFHIVHGLGDEGKDARKEWGKRWSHVMPLSIESFMKIHGIEKWEVNDKEKAVAKAKEREKLKEAAEEEARVKEKEARKERRSSFSSDVAST